MRCGRKVRVGARGGSVGAASGWRRTRRRRGALRRPRAGGRSVTGVGRGGRPGAGGAGPGRALGGCSGSRSRWAEEASPCLGLVLCPVASGSRACRVQELVPRGGVLGIGAARPRLQPPLFASGIASSSPSSDVVWAGGRPGGSLAAFGMHSI